MRPYKRVVAVLLALAAPVIGRAGPTLYDMQHSSVLRQRLPPYLRAADHPGKRAEQKPPERAVHPREGDAPSTGPAGTDEKTRPESPGAGEE